MADFSVDIQGLPQLQAALQRAPNIVTPILQRAIDASQALLAKHTIKGVVPWKTGYLTKTFQWTTGNLMGRWAPTASYAPYVEFGTGPHVIKPTAKKALYWPGANNPVKSVNHPGTKPQPFMEAIISEAQPEIDNIFAQALDMINQAILEAASFSVSK